MVVTLRILFLSVPAAWRQSVRNILIVSALALVAVSLLSQHHPSPDRAPDAVAEPVQQRFFESRYTLKQLSGPDLQLAVVGQAAGEAGCQQGRLARVLRDVCSNDAQCSGTTTLCHTQTEARYQDMLAGKPYPTPYVRITDPGTGYAAVLVAWGLNERDAARACRDVAWHLNMNITGDLDINCKGV